MDLPIDVFKKDLAEIMSCERFALMRVTSVYRYVDNKKTDTIEAIKYTVANPDTYENFDVKVLTTKAIVSQEQIEAFPEKIWLTFENAIVRPYKIEFGKVKSIVTADLVKIAE